MAHSTNVFDTVAPTIPSASLEKNKASPNQRRFFRVQLPRRPAWPLEGGRLSSLRLRIFNRRGNAVQKIGDTQTHCEDDLVGGLGCGGKRCGQTVRGEISEEEECTFEEDDTVAELPGTVFTSGDRLQKIRARHESCQRRRRLQCQRRITQLESADRSGSITSLRPADRTTGRGGVSSASQQPNLSSGAVMRTQRGHRQPSSLVLERSEGVNDEVDLWLSQQASPTPSALRHLGVVSDASTLDFDGVWEVEETPQNQIDDEHSMLFIRKGFLVDWGANLSKLQTRRGHTLWDGRALCLSPCGERLVVIYDATRSTRYVRWIPPQ